MQVAFETKDIGLDPTLAVIGHPLFRFPDPCGTIGVSAERQQRTYLTAEHERHEQPLSGRTRPQQDLPGSVEGLEMPAGQGIGHGLPAEREDLPGLDAVRVAVGEVLIRRRLCPRQVGEQDPEHVGMAERVGDRQRVLGFPRHGNGCLGRPSGIGQLPAQAETDRLVDERRDTWLLPEEPRKHPVPRGIVDLHRTL